MLETVDRLSSILMEIESSNRAEERAKLLGDTCFYYMQIGRAFDGIPRGLAARKLAQQYGLKNLERVAGNNLGAVYSQGACFEEACQTFERTLVLARELADPLLEALAFTNTAALLKEMGLYQDVIEVANKASRFRARFGARTLRESQ